MIKCTLLLALMIVSTVSVLCAASTQPPISDNRPLGIQSATLSSTRINRFSLLEVNVGLSGTYQGAFDPDQIDLHAIVTTPSGKKITVPGFLYQGYTRALVDGREQMTLSGNCDWRIRFSPAEVGEYRIVVAAQDSSRQTVKSSEMTFQSVKSVSSGFVRISKRDKRYFQTDDGRPYFPIGANVCWGGAQGTYDYDKWLPGYGKSDSSYFRVWLAPTFTTFALETLGPADGLGVGRINLANAWRLDYVLDLAQLNNLRVMLCIDSFNILRKSAEGAYGEWENSPQNAANGGPLKEPVEFWTDSKMLKAYKNKLRYLVARYGWRTNVLSWEFWNEVDIISPTAWDVKKATAWHASMAQYLRKIDPWQHLITTSFASSDGIPEIDSLPEMEYTQIHNYGSRDIPAFLTSTVERHSNYKKPCYVGEFGADVNGADATVDPTGVALHEGLWSTALNGAAGGANLWWWDNDIHPNNLYYHFAALTSFIKDIDFPNEGFKPFNKAKFVQQRSQGKTMYRDVDLGGGVSWDKTIANKPTTVVLDSKSGIKVDGEVSAIQHGMVNHLDLHNPLTIKTNNPNTVKLLIVVSGVSGHGGAALKVTLDGNAVISRDMPDDNLDSTETINKYNGSYPVEIPSGAHSVVVENTGTDWFYVTYTLENAVTTLIPDLRVYGLKGKNVSLAWVQNVPHNWFRVGVLKKTAVTQPASIMTLDNWPAGKYKSQIWDTITGKVVSEETVTVDKRTLKIRLPEIATDVALKIIRVK